MGVRTIGLLPRGKGRYWYWFANRDDCPWYPSARLFRQSILGDWRPVIARVQRELANFIAGAKASG